VLAHDANRLEPTCIFGRPIAILNVPSGSDSMMLAATSGVVL